MTGLCSPCLRGYHRGCTLGDRCPCTDTWCKGSVAATVRLRDNLGDGKLEHRLQSFHRLGPDDDPVTLDGARLDATPVMVDLRGGPRLVGRATEVDLAGARFIELAIPPRREGDAPSRWWVNPDEIAHIIQVSADACARIAERLFRGAKAG